MMSPEWQYILAGVVLLLANVLAWISTFFTLPGNWMIVAFAALSAWLLPDQPETGLGMDWEVVGVLLVLAALGELAEFVSGAAGAAKQGASRRGMLLALFGAAVGSVVGAAFGVPIPFFGPLVGALGGGALGAFGGAWLGESWAQKTDEQRIAVSKAALVGRLWGTVQKLAVGVIMIVVATIGSFAW